MEEEQTKSHCPYFRSGAVLLEYDARTEQTGVMQIPAGLAWS